MLKFINKSNLNFYIEGMFVLVYSSENNFCSISEE